MNGEVNMQIERTNSTDLCVNQLPDGSTIIVDRGSETVFALNATAGAAWNACSQPTTLAGVTQEMQRSFDPRATEELAEDAILQLQEKELVATSGTISKTTRRKVIATLGAVAMPLVVSLTLAEQRVYAKKANSTPKSSLLPGADD
jgi:hypothetical protein